MSGLSELSIENLALFERATLSFGAGLNVISGETGAGKSLLIGALELLLGERPRAAMVRKGATQARVEGRFELTAKAAASDEVAGWIDENLPAVREDWSALGARDARELVLCRTLSDDGKTRAWVNQRPVTQKTLRELARLLIEIHGQNEHQMLLEPSEQTRLLDLYGEHEAKLASYRKARARCLEIAERYRRFASESAERADRLELLRFQARELGEAKVTVDEHETLTRERDVLRHANELGAELGLVLNEISEGEVAALDLVRRAHKQVERWVAKVGGLNDAAAELSEAALHLEEGAQSLARFLQGVEASPERLERAEARLFQIETLERKYKADVAGIVDRERAILAEIADLESREESLEDVMESFERAHDELTREAKKLTAARVAVKARLKREVEGALKELGLERASFDALVASRGTDPEQAGLSRRSTEPEQIPSDSRGAHRKESAQAPHRDDARLDLSHFGVDGADDVEFVLAANPGEPAQPLRAVASGGETARIMLALRTVLAQKQTIPTLVFDEIDAGVGGRLGPKVGSHLRALAERHQVFCVTHLPAIAALAHHHFRVSKKVAAGRTHTDVAELSGDARVAEVADMIAGGASHATARAEAERLLGSKPAATTTRSKTTR